MDRLLSFPVSCVVGAASSLRRAWMGGRIAFLFAGLAAAVLLATGGSGLDRAAQGSSGINCTIVVNSAGDDETADSDVTLREAISFATGKSTPTAAEEDQITCVGLTDPGAGSADEIIFDLPDPSTISLTSSLPPLDTGLDVIDGTQGGTVIIDGGAKLFECLQVYSNWNVVAGLQIQNCRTGIFVETPGLPLGAGAAPAGGALVWGNTIASNVLIENGEGIVLGNTEENYVYGNRIGIDGSGAAAPNTNYGLRVLQSFSNYIGFAPSFLLGDALPAGGPPIHNIISGNNGPGISISGGGGNVIAGNYIGTNADGTAAVPNQSHGIRIDDSPNNIVGGTTAVMRNVISGNGGNGVFIDGNSASSNEVLGNYIGTSASGAAAIPNTGVAGVAIEAAPDNVIGGAGSGEGNVISGNEGSGVIMFGAQAMGNTIQGNLIGVAADGTTALGNGEYGIYAGGAGPNLIGGDTTGEGNTIAYSGNAGVAIVAVPLPSISKAILTNSIHSNGGLGIDLEDDGVTLNDPQDTDTGANGRQNYPVLSQAVTNGGTSVSGTLNSTPNGGFRLQFFASSECDPSGFGEGEMYLGETIVNTDGSGNAEFDADLPTDAPAGWVVTSTATDFANNTSEFSMCIAAQSAGTPTPAPTPEASPTPTPTPAATPSPTPGPTPTPTPPDGVLQGDVDCNDVVDTVDALHVLREVAGLPHPAECMDIAGDVNCDGAITAVDSLGILRFVAALPPLAVPGDCPAVGTPV